MFFYTLEFILKKDLYNRAKVSYMTFAFLLSLLAVFPVCWIFFHFSSCSFSGLHNCHCHPIFSTQHLSLHERFFFCFSQVDVVVTIASDRFRHRRAANDPLEVITPCQVIILHGGSCRRRWGRSKTSRSNVAVFRT